MSTNTNCKFAVRLIRDFKLNEDDFPDLKIRVMKKSVRYHCHNYLNKNKKDKDYMSLEKVEDLMLGFKQMLAFLVEELVYNKKN